MEKEILEIMDKFYIESLNRFELINRFELVWLVTKNKLELDHYGKIR